MYPPKVTPFYLEVTGARKAAGNATLGGALREGIVRNKENNTSLRSEK